MAWKEAAQRARDVRKVVVDTAVANAPIPSALLAELAKLAEDATAKLHAIPLDARLLGTLIEATTSHPVNG